MVFINPHALFSIAALTFLWQGYCFDKIRQIVIPQIEKWGNLAVEDRGTVRMHCCMMRQAAVSYAYSLLVVSHQVVTDLL